MKLWSLNETDSPPPPAATLRFFPIWTWKKRVKQIWCCMSWCGSNVFITVYLAVKVQAWQYLINIIVFYLRRGTSGTEHQERGHVVNAKHTCKIKLETKSSLTLKGIIYFQRRLFRYTRREGGIIIYCIIKARPNPIMVNAGED